MVACRADPDSDQPIVWNTARERGLLLSLELGEAVEPKRAVDEAAQSVYELGHVAGDDVVFFAETGKINKDPSKVPAARGTYFR